MRRFSQALLVILLCAVSAFAGGGRVVGIVGIWTYGDGKSIHFGFSLEDSQDVVCAESGSLTILLRDAGKPATLRCESKGARTNIKDFAAKNSQGSASAFFGQLYDLVSVQFSREPKTYIAAVSRGFGNPELEEAVLPVSGKRVDVAPALAGAPAGKYAVALFKLADDVTTGTPLQVDWRPGAAAMVPFSSLPGGLSKMAIVSDDGGAVSVAWVLLADPARFPRMANSFAEAKNVVRKWPGGMHGQASRSVLRAYLQALASGAGQ